MRDEEDIIFEVSGLLGVDQEHSLEDIASSLTALAKAGNWDSSEETITDWVRRNVRQAVPVRASVRWFAKIMEQQLRANDHKPGWKGDPLVDLFFRASEKLDEVNSALTAAVLKKGDLQAVINEAADAANMLMMLAENAQEQINDKASNDRI